VLKTADQAAITMLSGVASDREALELTKALSTAELVRIMNLIQTTLSGFTRSASRRMDAELCLIEMCQPELSLDAKAINARLTRLEETIKSGAFTMATPGKQQKTSVPEDAYDEDELPPLPDDGDAPPEPEDMPMPVSEAPSGFWTELVASARKELKPPASGFFVASPNAPMQGVLMGQTLELRCNNAFVAQTLSRPDILEVVGRKASAMLGKPVRVNIVDLTAKPAGNPRMEQLMNFGKAHSDIVRIKK
jgi:DNA polymerase-3 subunit gamma/tau